MADCPLGTPGCTYQPGVQRHSHPAPDLVQIGEHCTCGANQWRVTFGGLLPARVVCGHCQEGFNIGRRLRECGKPDTVFYGSNRR